MTTLLDPARLMVAAALCGTERTTEAVADHTGLDPLVVVQAIGTLRHAGLVRATDRGYVLPPASLRDLARATSEASLPMDQAIGYGMTDDERVVLDRFFSGRTLTHIPVDRAKRLVVLERLALEFDVGTRYDEADVNLTLRAFHPDVAALRRELVDEGMLGRDHGEYWRAGGRVPSIS